MDDAALKPMTMDLTRPDCALSEYSSSEKLSDFVHDFYEGRIAKPTHKKILPILMITNLWLEGVKEENIKASI